MKHHTSDPNRHTSPYLPISIPSSRMNLSTPRATTYNNNIIGRPARFPGYLAPTMSPTHTPPPSIPDDVDEDIGDEEIAFLEGEDYEIINEPDQEVVGIGCEDDASDMEDMAPQPDDCKFILKKHNESVFCVDIDPSGSFIASGAQDHTAIIWDAVNGTDTFVCSGHQDSVISVAFSPDGTFLATGDMAGGVFLWRRPSNGTEWSLHSSHALSDLLWLKWWSMGSTVSGNRKPAPQVLLAGTEDSIVNAILVSASASGAARPPKYLSGAGTAAIAAEIVPSTFFTDRPHIAVLYRSGDFRVWNLKTEAACLTANLADLANAGGGGVGDGELEFTCMAAPHPVEGSSARAHDIVAVGGLRQLVLVPCKPPTDEVNRRIPTSSLTPVGVGTTGTVEAIDFSWTHPFLAYGTVDGELGIYDTGRMRARQKVVYADPLISTSEGIGITVIRWSRTEPIFFAGTLGGTVVAWSGLSREPVGGATGDEPMAPLAIWRGHSEAILDLCLGPPAPSSGGREGFLVSASDDTTLRIFDLTTGLSAETS
ncbi:hypothetical protein SprV_0802522200 [Sparganum proliferum]